MKLGDIVAHKMGLATIVGKTVDGDWVLEYADKELTSFAEEDLYVVEEKNEPSEN